MNSISRPKYIQQIVPYIGKQIIKVLVGARRIGKTYLLYQIIDEIKKIDGQANIIFINKESYDFKNLRTDDDLYQYAMEKRVEGVNNYILVDEVQEIKNFETGLRYLLEKQFDIYCTGSNARILSSDLATFLSGRYVEIAIYSLSFSEFIRFHNLPVEMETLMKYIKYGGLPYLIHLELNDENVYHYLKNIYNSIILKDVVARYNIRDVAFLDRLVEFLCDNTGSLLSAKKIMQFLKSQQIQLSINTILNYISYLCYSFVVTKTQRYDIKGKKLFEINEKYFFQDLGLKHSLVPYQPADIQKVLENLVFNELQYRGYRVNVGKLEDLEIDFIARKNDETLYIQVAYHLEDEATIKREFGNLLAIDDNYPKMVISLDEMATGNYKGIQHKHLLEFLA